MLHKILQFGGLLLIFVFTLFLQQACKKTEHTSIVKPSIKVPESILSKWRSEGTAATYRVNKKSSAIVVDEYDKEINSLSGKFAALSAVCDMEDDDFVNNSFTLETQKIGFDCSVGYSVEVTYLLSTGFIPASINPGNPAQLSRGRFRLKNASGSVIYTNGSITPVTITPIGPDPANADKTLYRIVYKASGIASNLIETSVIGEHRPVIYTDCGEVITTPSDWQAVSLSGSSGSAPGVCDKIDLVHIDPDGSGNLVYFGGCDFGVGTTGISCYPFGGAGRPNEHDIEWRKPGDAFLGNWPDALPDDFINLTLSSYSQRVSWDYIAGQGCTGSPNKKERLAFFGTMSYPFPVGGIIEVRYRNVKLASPSDPCSVNDCTTGTWQYVTINVQ